MDVRTSYVYTVYTFNILVYFNILCDRTHERDATTLRKIILIPHFLQFANRKMGAGTSERALVIT